MAIMPGETRLETVACLASENESGSQDIFNFGPETEEERLKGFLEGINNMPSAERTEYAAEKIKLNFARENFSILSEIHPAWIVEVLADESPKMIGIILRYLPSTQVRYIIEHLPKRIKNRLPQLIDAFAVPAPVLDIIRSRFERQFVVAGRLEETANFGFEDVAYLKSKDMNALFIDLGLHELAMAFKGIERRSLNVLFNRLSVEEARALQQRIRSLTDVPVLLLKDAKYSVLELSMIETNPEKLLIELGLNSFAKAFGDADMEVYSLIRQKLEPKIAYTLKRYIDERKGSVLPGVMEQRKELVLKRIESLSKASAIDSELAASFPVKEEEIIITKDDSKGWHQEEGVL